MSTPKTNQSVLLTLPFENISNLQKGSISEADKLYQRIGRGFYLIPPDKIIVRQGFNVREDFGDIEGLANSMLKSGQKMPCYGVS